MQSHHVLHLKQMKKTLTLTPGWLLLYNCIFMKAWMVKNEKPHNLPNCFPCSPTSSCSITNLLKSDKWQDDKCATCFIWQDPQRCKLNNKQKRPHSLRCMKLTNFSRPKMATFQWCPVRDEALACWFTNQLSLSIALNWLFNWLHYLSDH